MKKGWKVFWIVCAVMAAAGIVMTAAGIALGGAAMLSNADESGPVHEWLQRTRQERVPEYDRHGYTVEFRENRTGI